MKSYAVFIATTGGAVQVQQITPERAPQSLVCQDRTTNVLPVSPMYDQFVKPGSGVIEREFGPFDNSSFRVDMSGPIDTGKSWQLGMFLAHALLAAPGHRLTEDIEAADEIIWATGCVDYHLNVTEVDHVPDKIIASAGLFENWAQMEKPVKLILSAGANETEAGVSPLPPGAQLFGVKDVWQAGEILGLSGAMNSQPGGDGGVAASGADQKSASGARKAVFVAAAIILIGGAAFVALQPETFAELNRFLRDSVGIGETSEGTDAKPAMTGAAPPATETAAKAPPAPKSAEKDKMKSVQPSLKKVEKLLAPAPKIIVGINRITPPQGSTCIKVQFGGANPVVKPISRMANGRYEDSQRQTTCGLRFDIDPGGAPKYLAVHLNVESGRFVQTFMKPASMSGRQKISSVQTWIIELPQKSDAPFSYQLVALVADHPLEDALIQLRSISDFEGATQELAKKNIDIVIHRHRVVASPR